VSSRATRARPPARTTVRHSGSVAQGRTPTRETFAIALMPVIGFVLAGSAAVEANTTSGGWLAFSLALAAGVLTCAIATVVVARRGKLFLRDQEAIARNRQRISRFGIPAGWLLGVALIATTAVGGLALVTVYALAGGALLGLWPGVFANYLRLRREKWTA
jgi:hypothetical protein